MTTVMKLLYFTPLLLLYIKNSFSYQNLKDVLNLQRGFETFNKDEGIKDKMRYFNKNEIPKALTEENVKPSRRRKSKKDKFMEAAVNDSSVSSEETYWRQNWKEYWNQKKFEAINDTEFAGDTVNMVAARPWGVSCGDPNQHDAPWGSCTLPVECDAEYRIYRGDYFCGRTQYICCAVQFTNYDLYQAFEQSFEDSLSTDTEERMKRKRSSSERRKKKSRQRHRERVKERSRRKRRIKRNIRKIVSEIRSLLQKVYRNRTLERKKKTRWMKKYVKSLKDQFKKDRLSIKDIHSAESVKADKYVVKTLEQMKEMNKKFITNSTYREAIQKYPDQLTESEEDEVFSKWASRAKRRMDADLQYDLDDMDDF